MDKKQNHGKSIYNRIPLSRNSKVTLVLRVLIISFCCIFFPFEAIIDSRLEKIELNSYLYNKGLLFIKSKTYQTFIDIVTTILGTNEAIMVYISIIYIIVHPFIGLKLILVYSGFQYLITVLKLIYQSHRPFWNSDKVVTLCKNSYPTPSLTFFSCCFFYLYVLIGIYMFQRKKFSFKQKAIIFTIYLGFISALYFMFVTTLFIYHHQAVYNIIMSIVSIAVLIDYDSKIYNFIFNSLKNLYNTRVYKMKIFYLVLGLFVLEYLSIFFIEDKSENKIKENLRKNKYCTEEDIETFGIKECVLNTSFISGLVGAFWGSAYTVEKKVGKWWDKNDKKKITIKVICTLVVCGIFITILYLSKSLKSRFELYFGLKTILIFLQSYCIFGLLPVFFQYINYNNFYEKQSYEKINLNITNENDVHLFRKSIFIHEKRGKSEINLLIDDDAKIEKKDKEKEKVKEQGKKEDKTYEDNNLKENNFFDNRKDSINDSELEGDDDNKKENEPFSMIINNLEEINEEEGDYELELDIKINEKTKEEIDKLKQNLINTKNDDDGNDNDEDE